MKSIKKTSIATALAGLGLASLLLANPAFAQNDPPGRVGRVGYSYGQVSFADAGSTQWTDLVPNRPISIGDSVFVGEQSRAELHVGNSSVRMNENTRLSFINLTDDVTQIQLTQGTVVLRVRAMSEREVLEISTPNLNFAIQEPGDYRININYDNTTTVIVRRGIGVAQGDRDIITLREGEQTRFSGTNLNHSSITRAPGFDTFDQWAYDRDRAEENSISARYVPRDMIGYQQLDEYGTWETHVEYGAVWYPRGVSVGWAPYRDGRWVWVAPWGWTWVDRSPWGFAPYHYGRWAFIGNRWAWCPGRYERHHRPVYAPALVAFVGASRNGVSVGVSVGGRGHVGPAVSWYPLGPGETYRPSYTQNPRYVQNINQTIINNTVVVNRNRDVYINRNVPNAVTSVPQQTFVRGEHVFPATKSILSSQIKKLEVMTEAPNLQPDRTNRFGDARPRTWQETDQYHSRATVTPTASNDASINNDTRIRDYGRGRGADTNANNLNQNTNGATRTAPSVSAAGNTQPNYVNPVERNANGMVTQYPQRNERNTAINAPANAAASQTSPQPTYVPPVERNNAGNVVQYPQRPERNEPVPAATNPNINQARSYDEIQAERGRNNRFDDANRNNRVENRRESINNAPQMSPAMTTPPTPVTVPVRPTERPIERNERVMERAERNNERNGSERLIERGNDRPIERPAATFAPRYEPVRVAPTPTPTPAPVSVVPQAKPEKTEKPKDKNDEVRAKRNER